MPQRKSEMNLTTRLPAQGLHALLLLAFLAGGTPCARAVLVSRGPYLQQGTTNSIVVRWRTDLVTEGFLRYGVNPETLTGLVSEGVIATDHVLQVVDLQPGTKYFYQIGTSIDWFPADTDHYFITSPPIGPAKP